MNERYRPQETQHDPEVEKVQKAIAKIKETRDQKLKEYKSSEKGKAELKSEEADDVLFQVKQELTEEAAQECLPAMEQLRRLDYALNQLSYRVGSAKLKLQNLVSSYPDPETTVEDFIKETRDLNELLASTKFPKQIELLVTKKS